MSNPPEDQPVQAVAADPEFSSEMDADTEAPRGMLGALKSPFVIGAIAVAVFGSGAGYVLTSGMFNSAEPAETVSAAVSGEEASTVEDEQAAQPASDAVGEPETTADIEEEEEEPLPQYGSISVSDSGTVYHTAPTTVTVTIGQRTGALTVSMGILADRETANFLLDEGLVVNLLKAETAQSIDFGPYLEWQVPGLITKAFKQKLADQFPDLQVDGIMLRDFHLTQS
ncbi:MAG: hypothetical protein AAFV37_06650 [Pseudomonadota bacterium]